MNDAPDLLLFDVASGGHQAEYLAHLLEAWHRSGRTGRIVAVGDPRLLEQQRALWDRALASPQTAFVPLPDDPPPPGASAVETDRRMAALLRTTIAEHRPRQVLVMRLDSIQIALARGIRFPQPVRLSGILFRPTLHLPAARWDLRDALRRVPKRLLLRKMGRNPHLATVFSLDPSAVPALRAVGLDAAPLPDPVETPAPTASPSTVRARFGIEASRRLLVVFGVLDARKNVLPLLDALARLPRETAEETAVLLAGPLAPSLRDVVPMRIAAAAPVQVVLHDAFVPIDEGQTLLAAADLVWAAYDRHIGSSAVLIRAAAAGRPVLSQASELMGEETRRHRLGRTVEGNAPAALAHALAEALAAPEAGFDADAAAAFARAHTPEAFARTILDRLAPAAP